MSKFKKTAQENAKISEENAKLAAQWAKNGIKQSAMLTPQIDKDGWAIIDNSVIGIPFQIPYSCSNTLASNCQSYENVKTVDECKEICKKDPLCQVGNFITMKGKTYCMPFAHTSSTTVNMSDSVWNLYGNYQNKNIHSATFLDYNLYSPWNSLDYSVYFGDKLSIKVSTSSANTKQKYIGDVKNSAEALDILTPLQLLAPGSLTDSEGEIKILNYFNVIINIFGTYLIIQQELLSRDSGGSPKSCSSDSHKKCKYQYTDKLQWFNGLGSLQNLANTCTLICLDKQPGEDLDYDDEVVFLIGDKYICIDNQNKIFIKPFDFLRKNKQYDYKFQLTPLFTVSYCNNENKLDIGKLVKTNNAHNKFAKKFRCIGTSIDKCTRIDNDFYYIDPDTEKKSPVYRGSWCYGICRDDGSVQHTNQIRLIAPTATKNLIIDQLIISISIIIISFALFMLLK